MSGETKRGCPTRGRGVAGVILGIALLGASMGAPVAFADEPEGAEEDTRVTSSGCVLEGTYALAKGTKLFDAATGDTVIGTFSGALVPMRLTEIPFDPKAGRARLATATGGGMLRLEGFVATSDLALFTARDVPVHDGHVWISSAQMVRLVGARASELTVELTVQSTKQVIRVTAPCDAFSLEKAQPQGLEIPSGARFYLTKRQTVELFDGPNGEVVLSLPMLEGSGLLFWSTEARAGFVRVAARADLVLDAWVRPRDLDPLKRGEMMEQAIPSETRMNGARLEFEKPPPLVRATRPMAIRAHPHEGAKLIGVVEPDAEIYVLETVGGWTNVLPKHLGVLPPDGGGFWISARELPR